MTDRCQCHVGLNHVGLSHAGPASHCLSLTNIHQLYCVEASSDVMSIHVSGDICWMDTVAITARVPSWAPLSPMFSHSGTQAGSGRLAEQQQRQLHGQLVGALDEHLPGQQYA